MTTGYPVKRGGHGKRIGVYADLPIKRCCTCLEPVVYRDEDGDAACFRCGQQIDPPVARVV